MFLAAAVSTDHLGDGDSSSPSHGGSSSVDSSFRTSRGIRGVPIGSSPKQRATATDAFAGETAGGTERVSMMHVVPWPVWGGPHNEALTMGLQGTHEGWRLSVVLPRDGGSAADRFRARGMNVVMVPLTRLRRTRSPRYWMLYPMNFLVDVWRLARLMRREHVDIVEGSSVSIQAAIAARLVGAVVVWRLADVSSPMMLRRVLGVLMPYLADAILVNGRATVPQYPGLCRAAGRVAVYYPMIDEAAFASPEAIPSRQPGTVVVGMVANINPDKGIDVFVEAAGLLALRPELRFILVGAEHDTHREYARQIHERVRQLGLDRCFEFTGERSDVAVLMRRMDVFVISSHHEGSTTTAIEAMASRLPVVATNVGAVGEVVADRETGFLVPPGDPVALAAAVEALVDDAQLRANFAVAGRKRFDDQFSLAVALCKRALIYRRAASRRHNRGPMGSAPSDG